MPSGVSFTPGFFTSKEPIDLDESGAVVGQIKPDKTPEEIELERVEADYVAGKIDLTDADYKAKVDAAETSRRWWHVRQERKANDAEKAATARQSKALAKARKDGTVRLSQARQLLDGAIARRREADEVLATAIEAYNVAILTTDHELAAAGLPNGFIGVGERHNQVDGDVIVEVQADGVRYRKTRPDAIGFWLWLDWATAHGWRRGLLPKHAAAFSEINQRPEVLGAGR